MNKKEELKRKIESGIQSFSKREFYIASDGLLGVMGYSGDRRLPLRERSAQEFISIYNRNSKLNHQKALVENWLSIELLFQLTGNDLSQGTQRSLPLPRSERIDQNITSYLFFALNLKDQNYSRTQLSDVIREINKLFSIPVMLVIKHGEKISVAIINRRPNKREPEKDVLEKVTLIKDVNIENPHRAHIDILYDLSFSQISGKHTIQDMETLHKAWQTILDIKELNKKFYKELSYWYFWAVKECTFPIEAGDDETRNPTSVIRLITRLIFIWFIKEKGLVPDELFDKGYLTDVLKSLTDDETTYYKAILQNLFFATLNQEDIKKRQFIKGDSFQGKNLQYGVLNIYRYKDLFTQPETALELFRNIPFLNGGLFECLDRDREENEPIPAGCEPDMRRADGFSQNKDNTLSVPNELFFGLERQVDLNTIYGTKNKRYKVRGLINILQSYKFTIEENTPLEEEVALDPELLGRVFENLLAAYNPETQTTARKATGSYYTPREIVNYMVDESLLAYLSQNLVEVNPKPEIHALSSSQPTLAGEHQPGLPSENLDEMSTSPYENRLRRLFSYSEHNNPFNEEETRVLIDAIGNVKVLDPACGSGAFPMGILHRLVFLLGKLDEHNQRWKQRQLEKVYEIEDPQARETAVKAIEEAFETNELNYGRKLYLIQNCIYGVDIQPIAGQIAKLRFFISLVVDQKVEDDKHNRGIASLPNLESKFVAANTLLNLQKPDSDEGHQMALGDDSIERIKEDLIRVRNKHFSAHTRAQKIACRKKDRELRKKLAVELQKFGWSTSSAKQLADWNPYDQNASADFFDPEWMFGIEDGFDVVIGNPPYITVSLGKKQKILSKDTIEIYKKFYSNVFEYKGNTFVFFIDNGIKILKPRGVISLIIPSTLLLNSTFEKIRKVILDNTRIRILLSMKESAFKDAVTGGNLILLFDQWRPINNQVKVREIANLNEFQDNLDFDLIEQNSFLKNEGFKFVFDLSNIDLINKIYRNTLPLGNIVKFYQGIITGDNKRFLSHQKKNYSYKPILRGKDINRYFYKFNENYILFEKDKLWSNTNEEMFKVKEKIINRQTSSSLIGAYDTKGYFTLDSTHVQILINNDFCLKYVLALFNSKLLNYIYNYKVNESKRVFAQVKIVIIKTLPIKIITLNSQKTLINLVDKILTITKDEGYLESSTKQAKVSEHQKQIDNLVYKLYGLTQEEIAIIEGKK